MQIEVGKRYLTRDGQMVLIHRCTPGDFPFCGILRGEDQHWREDGRFVWLEHRLDLVAEVGERPLALAEAFEALETLRKALATLAAQLEERR